MEEILASIRKIISDENPPVAEVSAAATDVVDLTQMVQDDGSVVDLAAVTPVVEPPKAAPPPPPTPAPVAAKPAPKPAAPVAALPPVAKGETLISEPAASASASALSSLANTIEIGRLATGTSGGTYMGNGGRTLEDMVIELMRPMLKQWLDQNLPATVDRLVQKEIERISNRAKD